MSHVAAVIDYAAAPPRRPRRSWRIGSGLLAVAGNWFIPGLGYACCARWRRGIGYLAIYVVFDIAILADALSHRGIPFIAVLLLPLTGLLHVVAAFDAFRCGRKMLVPSLHPRWMKYPLMVVLLIAGGVLNSVVASGVRYYIEAFKVASRSMAPTLVSGDRISVNRLLSPRRGDVVVYVHPDLKQVYVARIVAVTGDWVESQAGSLSVNGKRVQLPFGGAYNMKMQLWEGKPNVPMQLKPDEYFLMGDFVGGAYDSRYFKTSVAGHPPGAIPRSSIIGVATCIYWPRLHGLD